MFGDPEKVEFTNSSPQQRLPALQAGEFDILLSGVTVIITRAFQLGFHFGPTIFYDGQGILVRKDIGMTKAAELDGATIGVQSGTTGELNIADFFRKTGKKFTPVTIEDIGQFINALETGRVDAITQDSSDLVGKRTQLKKPDDYIILPERLSKEPLAPAITGGDDRWLEIVNWTVNATIQADEWGITSKNVDEFLKSQDPAVQRFLGVDPSLAQAIGLDPMPGPQGPGNQPQLSTYSGEKPLGGGSCSQGNVVSNLPARSDKHDCRQDGLTDAALPDL